MDRYRKKVWILVFIFMLPLLFPTACAKTEKAQEGVHIGENPPVIMATTTSTENSGLLDDLLSKFKEDTGIEVKVIAVGTGQALKLGENGEADVLLVHAKASEEEFVKAGHGLQRFDVMYNDFVLIGPKDDPLKIKERAGQDIVRAVTIIAVKKGKFISRGDDSGTHQAELKYWEMAGIAPQGNWYISAGKGMGETILIANEMLGYTLSDRATYLSMRDKIDLQIVVEGDSKLYNQYGIIAVNPDKNDRINHEGAQQLIRWILSEKGQKLIGAFGKDSYGQSLFIPNAE
ncbi:substrate-binding domain-containing protein [Thermotalea metallivorans]|uniref:PBP domain-containing protein n=1 Tax=Thermotalea metallivorans TaxID=520762 RepID=A0A140LAK9_9FIRM|nr:substrate-binding domain-containing protein [Thermotalea metallivorans]KXG77584.1 hypothetical protein AN619_04370 [Thermotalea metallivorans]